MEAGRRRSLLRSCVAAAMFTSIALVAGCGDSGPVARDRVAEVPVPSNVTIHESEPVRPPLPADLAALSGRLSELVDFHDEHFSGSWYDSADEDLHIGVATPGQLDELGGLPVRVVVTLGHGQATLG